MSDHQASIRRLRQQSNAAIAARDVEQVVGYMTPDVRVAVAGGPELLGRDASRAAFAAQFADPAFRGYVREPEQIVVREPAVSATERGRWTGRWQIRTGVHEQRGRYTAQWRFSEMGWLIADEVFLGGD